MPEEVFKIQLSITTTAATRQALVYNRDRSVMGEYPADAALLELMGDRLKAFFLCTLEGSTLRIGEEAEDPGW